jgi:hypothetical protein
MLSVLSTYHRFYDSIHCWIPDEYAQQIGAMDYSQGSEQ